MDTQLTSASGYDTSRMIFSDPSVNTIPDSKPAIVYRRINIQTRNADGTSGDLIIPTSQLFSFGVQEELSPDTGKLNGYKMAFCMWNRDGPTDDEREWTTTFDRIVERCKQHLIQNREEIEKYELEMNDLKTLNPLYYKKEKGKVVEGTGPTLYTKLVESKKLGKILTMFFDFDGNPLDPRENLIGKYCTARGAVKIESIFIGGGNKISMQIKLYECEVRPMETGMKRLLSRPKADGRVLTQTPSRAPPMATHDSDGEDEVGSLAGSDTEESKAVTPVRKPAPPSAPPVVRKIKKVVRKVAGDE